MYLYVFRNEILWLFCRMCLEIVDLFKGGKDIIIGILFFWFLYYFLCIYLYYFDKKKLVWKGWYFFEVIKVCLFNVEFYIVKVE